MANREKGEVVLEWGERKLVLLLDINALAEMEDLLDAGVFPIVQQMELDRRAGRPPRIATLRAFIWAGTREHAPDIDLKTAGKVIGDLGIPVVQEAVAKAIMAAFPQGGADQADGEAGEAEEDPPATPGPGGDS